MPAPGVETSMCGLALGLLMTAGVAGDETVAEILAQFAKATKAFEGEN